MSDPKEILRLIAQGYLTNIEEDRFIILANPDYTVENDKDPFIVWDCDSDETSDELIADIDAMAARNAKQYREWLAVRYPGIAAPYTPAEIATLIAEAKREAFEEAARAAEVDGGYKPGVRLLAEDYGPNVASRIAAAIRALSPGERKPAREQMQPRPHLRPDGFPTRNDLQHFTPPEHAIRAAMLAVEAAGGSEHLTRAVTLLGEARDAVAVEDGWNRDMEAAPKGDELFLAYCPPDPAFPDGRMMIWRGSILAMQGERTPHHLQYPATHWRPLPPPPKSEGE